MRSLVKIVILGLLIFSCSKSSADKEITSNVKALDIDNALTGDPEEHRSFKVNSGLTVIPVKTYHYDLDSDGQLDKVELFNFEEYANDPGDFQRIRIELANGKVLDEYNLGIRANSSMPHQNEISSDLISIVKMGHLTFLITYGWYFASDPSKLTIFEFSSGKPRRVFGQNFETHELILNDGIILTGYKRLRQAGYTKKPELYELRIENNKLVLKTAFPKQGQ